MCDNNKDGSATKGFIQGTLIDLLPLNSEHAEIYNKWNNDRNIRLTSGYVFPSMIEKEKKKLDNLDERQISEIHFEIWHRKDKKPVGHAAIFQISWTDRHCEIGLIIGESDYWSKGIATETGTLLFNYCFKELNLHSIITRAAVTNNGSWRVSEKLGMKRESVLREYFYSNGTYEDAYIYGVLKNEWIKKKFNK